MTDDDYLRWLVDRADRLRATIATSAGLLVTADVVVMSGQAFLTRTLWNEIVSRSPMPLHLLAQMGVLLLGWLALFAALGRALGAIAAANGFRMSHYPSQGRRPAVIDPKLLGSALDSSATVREQLSAAIADVEAARESLHQAGFNLILAPCLVSLSVAVQGFFND